MFQLERTFHSYGLDAHACVLLCVLSTGGRSINYVLNAMVFNVVPTALEIGIVASILACKFGPAYAGVTLATLASYTAFTVGVTKWRTKFRKRMNALENEGSTRVIDSLINFETVKPV